MAAKKGAKKGGSVKGVSKYYELSGDSIKSKKSVCPRCGNGVFLASHADRQSCGKCGYTEFKK
ncbi:MAG TPA: 30S ribosomal protein S27ae [Methanothrix sp.]|nr:30S ribosomal protein S27ae [Methanothrix sp.]